MVQHASPPVENRVSVSQYGPLLANTETIFHSMSVLAPE